jgi:alpha-mannosidase
MKNNHRQIDLMANEYGLFMAKNNIMKRKTGRRWLLMLLGAGCMIPAYAQFEKDIYTCDEETYRLLKDLSDSQLGNGSIYLFTTTHQDLAWLNHLDACIADRDTLWLTPFLNDLRRILRLRWILSRLPS